jgi:hypothetical protein
MQLAGITFLSLALSYWTIKPWFLTEGKLAAVLITPSLGVPNWPVIYIINTAPPISFLVPLPGIEEEEAPTSTRHQKFSGAVAGEKEVFCKGSFARTSFTLFIFCFTLFSLAPFYQKYKKNSFLYSCYFISLSSL